MKSILYLTVFFFFLNACKGREVCLSNIKEKEDLIYAEIDTISLAQIQQVKLPNQSIFEYYNTEIGDEVAIWSDKMFGRCCTEADLLYSELLYFDISTTIDSVTFLNNNLSDTKYGTYFAFNENQNVEISLKLDRTNEGHIYYAELTVDEVLKSNDTILKPFKLSLVNGNAKSKETFDKNGRVKAMKVFIDNNYISTVLLIDTPLVQEFTLDIIFYRNSVIKLIPVSYYKGSKYDNVCISEIQNSLAHITHPSINGKYKINELRKK